MFNLKNQVAVVTGASSGIGKAITLSLAAQGATLCLIGRNLKRLDVIAESAKETASHIKCYQIDLTMDDDIYKLWPYLQQDFGYVDILVHSAGVFSMGTLECTSIKDLDSQYKVNVRAPYLLTQVLLPMIKSRQGQIVFINSSVVLNARANLSQYAATKYALKAIADALRAEVNVHGVRVLSIYPGRTATPMQAAVCEMEGKQYHPDRFMQPEDVAEVVVNAILLQKTVEITDINVRPLVKFE